MRKVSGAIREHQYRVVRQQTMELAITITALAAIGSVFVGFGVISALLGA